MVLGALEMAPLNSLGGLQEYGLPEVLGLGLASGEWTGVFVAHTQLPWL